MTDNFVENAKKGKEIVFWNKSGRLPASSVKEGTVFFHRVKGTKKILGKSVIKSIEFISLGDAWKKYSPDLGFESLEKIYQAASRMEGATELNERSQIVCFVLTQLEECNLDIKTDLPKMGIYFGNYPRLPTVGKSLLEAETQKLLLSIGHRGSAGNYLEKAQKEGKDARYTSSTRLSFKGIPFFRLKAYFSQSHRLFTNLPFFFFRLL